MSWFTSCQQLNTTHEFSWFDNNNSATIKDMENLSTKMNCNGLMTSQTKFQSSLMKDKRKTFIFSEFALHREVQNFGAEYFKTLILEMF